jgi:hypothetical protein
VINLFYDEPDDDRWMPFDRYPRRVLRRVVRGRPMVGGQKRVFLNLCAGLQRLGVPFRLNDYRHARAHAGERVGILGKPHVLDRQRWENPIVFGPALFSHPSDDPALLTRLPIERILVPGEWMRLMCEPAWGARVFAWPVGIETDKWSDASRLEKRFDVLVYDKIRWRRDELVPELLEPVRAGLAAAGLRVAELRYGFYKEDDFHRLLAETRAMVFLCEHETQGIAYQQALARNVPVLAWDRGGYWQDPSYYPRVKFGPVSSVPYWDARCGMKFTGATDFSEHWARFWDAVRADRFSPRSYVVEHLTLERAAEQYLALYHGTADTDHASVDHSTRFVKATTL